MPGSTTALGQAGARDNAPTHVAFRQPNGVGIRDDVFRGSMAGLCDPLPTLRRCPHGRLRTARGRCGLLYLHRGGLHHLLLAGPPAHCGFDPLRAK